MTLPRDDQLAQLDVLRMRLKKSAEEFLPFYQQDIETYQKQISLGMDMAIESLEKEIKYLSGDNRVCGKLLKQATDYVSWMQWALWDLPYFALALRPPLEIF